MSSVSPDNQGLTRRVADLRARYAIFQTTLRGGVGEVLSALGNGLQNMMTMNTVIEKIGQAAIDGLYQSILEDLSKLSEGSLKTSKAESDASIREKALAVSDALHKGFAAELLSDIERAVMRDVRSAQEFVRIQLASGRFVATTDELQHDLLFKISDRAGKQLDTADFVYREVNWAYRAQYNTIQVHVLLARGIEEAVVDGGSKSGTAVDLMKYDEIQPTFFHHNSKSLLQPID